MRIRAEAVGRKIIVSGGGGGAGLGSAGGWVHWCVLKSAPYYANRDASERASEFTLVLTSPENTCPLWWLIKHTRPALCTPSN